MSHLDDIVDQREQAAPLSELGVSRMWGMLESAPDGMLMTDASGVILAVNRQVELLFGYDRADLLGLEVEILLPERFRSAHRSHRRHYRDQPTVRAMGGELELSARRRDGAEFPVEVSLSPLIDDDGVAIVASIRDVSERKRADAHARRIQTALDAIHDGVFMFDPEELRFVYANQGASAQVGYSNDELLTMTPLDIKPHFTREAFEALIAPLVDGSVGHLAFRTVHRSKSGVDMPVEIVLEHRSGIGDGDGPDLDTGALLVAVVRDVTQQVAVERRLALSEETFRTSFDNAPVGMAISRIDATGVRALERVNLAFAQMLRRPLDELLGIDIADIAHPEDRHLAVVSANEMVDGARDAFIAEQRYLRADGTYVWALMHATVIERTDEVRVLTHVVDITDRRERQAQRERMSLMEDRERIARDIHDLVIQRLFGAGMKLQAVIPEMRTDTAVERAHDTIDELDEAIRELRSAIFSLQRPPNADSVSDAIRLSIEQNVDGLGFRPDLTQDGSVESLTTVQANELVATLREALSNVARHAGASSAEVRVAVSASAVCLVVSDDGRGLLPGRPHGNGLKNMAERAERLGGEFRVRDRAPNGCELTWTVPR